MRDDDKRLGMDRDITRRDFISGVSIAASGALLSPVANAATDQSAVLQNASGYYPPARAGMRGNHPGSFESAHLQAMTEAAIEQAWRATQELFDAT